MGKENGEFNYEIYPVYGKGEICETAALRRVAFIQTLEPLTGVNREDLYKYVAFTEERLWATMDPEAEKKDSDSVRYRRAIQNWNSAVNRLPTGEEKKEARNTAAEMFSERRDVIRASASSAGGENEKEKRSLERLSEVISLANGADVKIKGLKL